MRMLLSTSVVSLNLSHTSLYQLFLVPTDSSLTLSLPRPFLHSNPSAFTTDLPRPQYAAAAAPNAAAGALPPSDNANTQPPPVLSSQPTTRELLPPVPPPAEQIPYTAVVHPNPNPMTLAPIAAFNTPTQLSHPVTVPVPQPPTSTLLSPGRSTVRSSPTTPRQTAPRASSDLPSSRTSPNLRGVNRAPRTSSGVTRKRATSPRTVARRSGAANTNALHNPANTGAADAVLPRGSVVKITGNNRTKRELLNRQGLVLSAQTLGGWHEVALYDGANVRVQRNALTLLDAPSEATVAMLPPPPSDVASVSANIAHLNKSSLERYRKHHRLPLPDDAPRDALVIAVKRHFAKAKVNEAEVIRMFLKRLKPTGNSTEKSL